MNNLNKLDINSSLIINHLINIDSELILLITVVFSDYNLIENTS